MLLASVLTAAACGGGLSKDEQREMDFDLDLAYQKLETDVNLGADTIGYDTGFFIGRVRFWVKKGMEEEEAETRLADAATLVSDTCPQCAAALDRERERISD